MWEHVQADRLPLSTTSMFGEWVPILVNGEKTGRLQYRGDIEYEWLFNPPIIHERAWAKKAETGGGYRTTSNWTFGSARDLATTRKAVEDGNPTDKIKKVYAKAKGELNPIILPAAPSVRRKRIFNPDDGEPDTERAIAGSEDYLVRKTKVETEKRIVHLAWQMAHSCAESEDSFARQAACAVAVTDHLEKCGYRVRLTGYVGLDTPSWFQNNEAKNVERSKADKMDEIILATLVKHENTPLDEMKVLTLGLSGVFRHYQFAWITSVMGSSVSDGDMHYGLGRVLYAEEFSKAVLRKDRVTAMISSDAPLTMRTIIAEL